MNPTEIILCKVFIVAVFVAMGAGFVYGVRSGGLLGMRRLEGALFFCLCWALLATAAIVVLCAIAYGAHFVATA